MIKLSIGIRKRKQRMITRERKAIRVHHRTMFSHGRYDDIVDNGFLYTWFD